MSVFVFLSLIILISSIYEVNGVNVVSEKELEDYAKRYLEKYHNLCDTYKDNLGDLNQFKLYSNYPYYVKGIISEKHGAAIFFYPSENETIEVETIPERIEFYLWPVMKEYSSDTFWEREYPQDGDFESYEISANLQIGDGETPTYAYSGENTLAVFLDAGYPTYDRYYHIRVMPLGRLRIDGTLIYENRMILKGANDVDAWATDVASIDATNEFLRLARKHVLNQAELKQIACLSSLVAKAEQIGQHFVDGSYRNEDLRWKEEREFWDIVNNCEIEKELARNILNEVIPKEEESDKPPPFGPSNPLYWVVLAIVTIACGLTVFLIGHYVLGWKPNLFKSKSRRSKKKRRS